MSPPEEHTPTKLVDHLYKSHPEYKTRINDPPKPRDDELIHRRKDLRHDPAVLSGFFVMTPLSYVFDGLLNFQGGASCGSFEMRMVNCLEANGLPKGLTNCRPHMDDYYECFTYNKRFDRTDTMLAERRRQYRNGERKVFYAVPPAAGSFDL